MATPLEIDIALHYWTTGTDYGAQYNNFDAPAVVEQREQMVAAGLLKEAQADDHRRFAAGPALECYVNALCAVPWPVQTWAIPSVSSHKRPEAE